VVEPHEVDLVERVLHAPGPPPEAALLHAVPVVNGIAPALALRGEGIGRHARDDGRLATVVEAKERRVGPHVGTVGGHVDGQIAEELDVAVVAVLLQGRPLPVEQVLPVGMHAALVGEALAGTRKGIGVALGEGRGPVVPRGAVVVILDGGVHRVVVEPVGLIGAELLKREALEGGFEHTRLARHEACVVDVGLGKLHEGRQVGLVEEPLLQERLGANQERIAGKRRQARIGRGAVPHRTQRKHLPDLLFGAIEEVDKGGGRGSEIADPVAAREGGDVKQNATDALGVHRDRTCFVEKSRAGTACPHRRRRDIGHWSLGIAHGRRKQTRGP
jgi:hypothetical protein